MDILFKTSSLRLLFTLYNSYGFKESLLTWAKIKFFFRLYENVVLKNKNVLNKCSFPQLLRLHTQNPKSFSWRSKVVLFKITDGHSTKSLASSLMLAFFNTHVLSTFLTSSSTNMWEVAKEKLTQYLHSNGSIESWGVC